MHGMNFLVLKIDPMPIDKNKIPYFEAKLQYQCTKYKEPLSYFSDF